MATSIPDVRAEKLSWVGSNHDQAGWIDPLGALPPYTLARAVMANTTSMMSSMASSPYWTSALISMPM